MLCSHSEKNNITGDCEMLNGHFDPSKKLRKGGSSAMLRDTSSDGLSYDHPKRSTSHVEKLRRTVSRTEDAMSVHSLRGEASITCSTHAKHRSASSTSRPLPPPLPNVSVPQRPQLDIRQRRFHRRRSNSQAPKGYASLGVLEKLPDSRQKETSGKPLLSPRNHTIADPCTIDGHQILSSSLCGSGPTELGFQSDSMTISKVLGQSSNSVSSTATLSPKSAENLSLQEQVQQLQQKLSVQQDELDSWKEQAATAKAQIHQLEGQLQDFHDHKVQQLEGQLQDCPKNTVQEQSAASLNEVPLLQFMYASPLLMNNAGQMCSVPRLKAEDEIPKIEKALGNSISVRPNVASVNSLREVISQKGTWIHLSCHTSGSLMMLEDINSAEANVLTPEKLEQFLKACGGVAANFVFIAACKGKHFAHAFREAGAQNVIYCASEVRDKAATDFACHLYRELANNRCLLEAFNTAVRCADLCRDTASYKLLTPDGNLKIAPGLKVRELQPFSHSLLLRSVSHDRDVEDFVGRQEIISRVLQHLRSRRVVVLHSQSSNGRTATLREICRYVTTPGRMFDGHCAVYPARPPAGGLLIVDDADELLNGEHRKVLDAHLESPKARLLLACRSDVFYDSFAGAPEKPVCVPLPPLSVAEATDLFLRRCHRPLQEADLSPAHRLQGVPTQVVDKRKAFQVVSSLINVFEGDPLTVRRAGSAVRPGSPLVQGNLRKLVSG